VVRATVAVGWPVAPVVAHQSTLTDAD